MSICSTAAPDPNKRVALTITDGEIQPIFIPVLQAFKVLGIGATQGWGLVGEDKIKTVVRNGRRLAIVESVEELAQEWMEQPLPQSPRPGLGQATAASLESRRLNPPKRRMQRARQIATRGTTPSL
jgi:hypothetical protein